MAVEIRKISRWEKFLLLFYKRQKTFEDSCGTRTIIEYKRMMGRTYILENYEFPIPPQGYSCRHEITKIGMETTITQH